MSGRFLVFGDIHGEWQRLADLLEQVKPDYEWDEVVFLGDYVDRGPEPKRVLDYLMQLPQRDNIHLLRGNHECMLWDAFAEFWNAHYALSGAVSNIDWWKREGGSESFRQLSGSVEEFKKYADFVNNLPLMLEADAAGRTYIFAHAGVDPDVPLDDQRDGDLVHGRYLSMRYKNHEPIKYLEGLGELANVTVVAGHTPTCKVIEGCYEPIVTPEVIFMDTGSYMPEGHISCMDLISRQIWQSRR